DKLRMWDLAVERQHSGLGALMPDLLVVQLGGPIGNRAGLGVHGDFICEGIAKRLGLRAAPPWHTMRDRIVNLASRLAMLTGTLGKVGTDIALMAQSELRAVTLSDGGGSSSMPHKSNPVGAELLIALARFCA